MATREHPEQPSGVDRRKVALAIVLAVIVIVPPVIFIAGGGSSKDATDSAKLDPAAVAAAGCQLHEFEHGVTNDPQAGRAYEQEALFGNHPPLPRGGWHGPAQKTSLPTVLHTLSHEWLVVEYPPSLDRSSREQLQTWAETHEDAVAVIAGSEGLDSAFAAIKWGHGLNCTAVTAESLALLGDFDRDVKATLPGS